MSLQQGFSEKTDFDTASLIQHGSFNTEWVFFCTNWDIIMYPNLQHTNILYVILLSMFDFFPINKILEGIFLWDLMMTYKT